MIELIFEFDNRQISSKVTEYEKEKNIIEYEVEVDDKELEKEFGNPIVFRSEYEFFSFKDPKDKQGQRALDLLFSFKSSLNWFRDKQPDMEI